MDRRVDSRDPSLSGNEPSVELSAGGRLDNRSERFELRPASVSADAEPIFDEKTGHIVGYRDSRFSVARYYDLEGSVVAVEEPGIESPLFDPVDLIGSGFGLMGSLGRGLSAAGARSAARSLGARAAVRLTTAAVAKSVSRPLMATFRRLTLQRLQFTATTAARMASKGRRVPIHILHLAVRHGRRVPDPKGVKGAFMYYSSMHRNGSKYAIEVLVRERDYTILQFLYK